MEDEAEDSPTSEEDEEEEEGDEPLGMWPVVLNHLFTSRYLNIDVYYVYLNFYLVLNIARH